MLSRRARSGGAQFLSEFVATFGLVAVIAGCSRQRPASVPFAVASYIGGLSATLLFGWLVPGARAADEKAVAARGTPSP